MTEEQLAQELIDIAEDVQKVYEAGQKSEYDRFWDAYQENGNKTNYSRAFGGTCWTKEIFRPKYDMYPSYAYAMFWANAALVGDLDEIMSELGVILDFKNCLDYMYCFSMTKFTAIGTIVASKASGLNNTFSNSTNLKTIRLLKLDDAGTKTFPSTFNSCTSLENITIEGVIGQNLDIHWSPLTHESIMSIINHLGTIATAKTLTLGTTNLAKLTDAEKAIATQRGWTLA